MMFIPKEYDLHHSYSFIPMVWIERVLLSYLLRYEVHTGDVRRRSSYRSCVWSSYRAARYRMVLLGQRSSESVEAKSIYAFEILDSAWSMHAAMTWTSMENCYPYLKTDSYAGKSIPDETFCWKFGFICALASYPGPEKGAGIYCCAWGIGNYSNLVRVSRPYIIETRGSRKAEAATILQSYLAARGGCIFSAYFPVISASYIPW